MAQQCDCVVRILKVWGRFFGEALVHVLGEVLGAEDIAAVDRHDGGNFMEIGWMMV